MLMSMWLRKPESSVPSVPKKIHRTDDTHLKDSPLKKRLRSVNPMEGSERPLTISPQQQIPNKGNEGENRRMQFPSVEPGGPSMILSMKFPLHSMLLDVSEAEAKFARFVPIDASGIHINWDKSICQVVFAYMSDAEKAYEHAVKSENMFGENKVIYILHDVKVPMSELAEGHIPGANVGNDDHEVATLGLDTIELLRFADEMHREHCEKMEASPSSEVNSQNGRVDINDKMLPLLRKCYRIVAFLWYGKLVLGLEVRYRGQVV